MTYLSLFSGIEAASAAWHPLGWRPVAFSEIEPFPCAVLAHHYPGVPNYGDVTKHKEWPHADVDVVVGGSPCQAFSVAGLRKGLDDPRGNLTLTYLAVVEQYRPRWVVWENVPGVLSVDGGRVFGAFLGALGELGYGFAYRVLDAQYVRVESHPRAVPQRRRRVFVVGCLGDWRRAAAVLFERESLQRHTPPRRESGKGYTVDVAPSIGASGRGFSRTGETRGQDPVVSGTVSSKWAKGTGGPAGDECQNIVTARETGKGFWTDDGTGSLRAQPGGMPENLVAHTLRADGFDASEDGTGRGTPLIACDVADSLTVGANQTFGRPGGDCVAVHPHVVGRSEHSGPQGKEYLNDGSAYTQDARGVPQVVAFDCKASGQNGFGVGDVASTMRSMGHAGSHSNGGGHQAVAFEPGGLKRGHGSQPNEYVAPTLRKEMGDNQPAVAFAQNTRDEVREMPVSGALAAEPGMKQTSYVRQHMHVRRLTPRECERLQGFPDDYTLVPYRGKPASDGPRYKALGNSMAVNVMRWIGERIAMVDEVAR